MPPFPSPLRTLPRLASRSLPASSARSFSPVFRRAAYVVAGGAGVVSVGSFFQVTDLLFPPVALDAAIPSTRTDPATSIPFPVKIQPLSLSSPVTLVGLGVRTVSFLRVKVYSVGFYAPEGSWWKEANMGDEATMETFLASKTPCALRIVPSRNTGFDHLRDGFVRAVQARMKERAKKGEMTDDEAQLSNDSLNTFKSFFPARSASTGQELLLVKTPSGGLAVEFEGTLLGQLDDPGVMRDLFAGYFMSKNPNSEKMRSSVLDGFKAGPEDANL